MVSVALVAGGVVVLLVLFYGFFFAMISLAKRRAHEGRDLRE
jgi:hypothetical protein